MKAYTHFRLEDFIADEYFIRWVKSPSPESSAFWEAFLVEHPYQKQFIQEAQQYILLLDIQETYPPEDKADVIWQNIMEAVNHPRELPTSEAEPSTASPPRWFFRWYSVSAASVLLLAVFAYLVYQNGLSLTIRTAYGESKTIFLPDSTQVTLNANSSLRYSRLGFQEKQREVWLDGEAFFSVVHKRNGQNFLVHTPELQVEVLGTRFNVHSRRGTSKVVLEEGKIQLTLASENGNPPVVMHPQDLVEFSSQDKNLVRKTIDPVDYLSWRHNRLTFIGTPLLEISQLLEDNYGYQVLFREEELKHRKFTGSASGEDIAGLIQKLDKLFNLDIQQDGNRLIIQSHKENPGQPSLP